MRPKRHAVAAALALLLGACSVDAGPPRVVEPRVDAAPAARGEALLRAAMLDGHNRARAAVGVPPLVWDDALAASAQEYAREMAQTGRFAHAEQPQGPGREGENLFTGTRGAYRYDEMVQLWVDEQRDFVNRAVPGSSRSRDWGGVAHYVQIVWRDTKRVGCATASGREDDFLVCRYLPPGNVVGQTAF
ncbi:CAP domain-containing protein [Sphingomonas adhaesiva]|uniref:CAP domain-containing protein n=1 Tax=Sphingomonas adhaesiva TaxID=28212 RepID=UPI002FFA766D